MNSEVTGQGKIKRKLPEPSVVGHTEPYLTAPSIDGHITVCKGQTVYVYTPEDAWEPAVITDVDPDKKTLSAQLEGSYRVVNCSHKDVLLRSEQDLYDHTNLTHVTPVHEASVLTCLYERFISGRYYTYAGTTVVAINPFSDVSYLYTPEQIKAYHAKNEDLPPHIYPIAETAYTNLVRDLGSPRQGIIINGESGAGKTVTTKHLLKYLTVVSNLQAGEHNNATYEHKGRRIERRILDSNPILEAFGNAATPRNNNSSRFGKFIDLQFMRTGHMQGGAIQTYLLEKTRLVHQGTGENNFHIFYQITGTLLEDQRHPDWLLDIKEEIADTSFSGVPNNQDCSENSDVMETLDAMIDIGVSESQQRAVVEVLLAILYLINLQFVRKSDDSSDLDHSLETEKALERSCQLLGLNPSTLKQVLLHRSIAPGGRTRESVFLKPICVEEARSRRDCLSMLLYSRLFEWLVGFINHQIKSESFGSSIGLLDIYGFEAFMSNSLEQLCINYANERLQQHYVTHFLKHLQAEYEQESIPWVSIYVNDNQSSVDILDGQSSIFSILNEEVYLNRKLNDEALNNRILKLCSSSAHCLRAARLSSTGTPCFVVQHYAGDVAYSVCNLVTKNRDDIPADLVHLLSLSKNPLLQELFKSHTPADSPGKKKKSVLIKFKSSLDTLMASLVQSDLNYIRCLKPNQLNSASQFEPQFVLSQLRACGTVETINICRHGYPARMPYQEFLQRYSVILRRTPMHKIHNSEDEESHLSVLATLDIWLRQQQDQPRSPMHTPIKKHRRRSGLTRNDHARRVCATVLQAALQGEEDERLANQFGRTKIFLLEHQLEMLEHARMEVINEYATVLQAAWKCFCCRRMFKQQLAAHRIQRAWTTYMTRKRFLHLRVAACRIQQAWVAYVARTKFLQLKEAACKIQRAWGAYTTRRRFLQLREATCRIQQAWVAYMARTRFMRLKKAAYKIQQARAAYGGRKQFLQFKKAALVLQRHLRRWLKRQQAIRFQKQQQKEQHNDSTLCELQSPSSSNCYTHLAAASLLSLSADLDIPPASSHLSLSVVSDIPPASSPLSLSAEFDTPTASSCLSLSADSDIPPASRHLSLSPDSDMPPASSCLSLSGDSDIPPASSLLSLSADFDIPPASVDTVDISQDPDLSGNLSDDSGVMLLEPKQQASPQQRKPSPHAEQQKLPQKRNQLAETVVTFAQLHGFHLGDGIISRYGISKPGIRFHTRASVLKYGHVINRRDMPMGLADILPQNTDYDSPTLL